MIFYCWKTYYNLTVGFKKYTVSWNNEYDFNPLSIDCKIYWQFTVTKYSQFLLIEISDFSKLCFCPKWFHLKKDTKSSVY